MPPKLPLKKIFVVVDNTIHKIRIFELEQFTNL